MERRCEGQKGQDERVLAETATDQAGGQEWEKALQQEEA